VTVAATDRTAGHQPAINKYYALDLAPGRSLVEYLVHGGQQVFVISWRNRGAWHADWGLDTYMRSVLDAVQGIRGTDRSASGCGAVAARDH
jgi:polyhydroxyalkanoate synthase